MSHERAMREPGESHGILNPGEYIPTRIYRVKTLTRLEEPSQMLAYPGPSEKLVTREPSNLLERQEPSKTLEYLGPSYQLATRKPSHLLELQEPSQMLAYPGPS